MVAPSLKRQQSRFAEQARQEAADRVLDKVENMPENFRAKYEKIGLNVGVAIKVISITHLDMSNNTFEADFNLNIAWVGNKDSKPEVQIYNLMEAGVGPDEGPIKEGELDFDYYYRIRYKGRFRQQYKLRHFPFDKQELTIRVRFKTECTIIDLPWGPTGHACSCDPDAIEDDFFLKKAEVRPKYLPSFKFGKLGGYDPEAQVVFLVQRHHDYWLYNYGYLMSLVCTFCFASFALPVGDLSGRLGIGFTLNLTVVATFYLMQEKLPPVSYYTELEHHMVVCIGFTMLVMVVNIAPAIIGEWLVEKLERLIVMVLASFWIGYHIHVSARFDALAKDMRTPGFVETFNATIDMVRNGYKWFQEMRCSLSNALGSVLKKE